MLKARRLNYSPWLLCALCALVAYFSVGTISTSFSVQLPYMKAALKLSNTQSSMIISVRTLSQVASFTACVFILRRFKLKWTVAIGLLLGAAGFMCFAYADGYTMCLVGAILCGLCYGFAGNSVLSALARNWFSSHCVFAIGIITAASGVATAINPIVIEHIVTNFSIQANFFVYAVAFTAMALVTAFFIKDSPNNTSISDSQAKASAKVIPSDTRGRLCFALCCTYIFFQSSFIYVAWAHIPQLYSSEGWSSVSIAVIVSVSGIVLALSKIGYGWIVDRFTYRKTAGIFMSFSFFSMLISCFGVSVHSLPLQIVNMIFYSLGGALGTVGISSLAMDFSDAESYKGLVNIFNAINCLGGVVLSPMMGLAADHLGNYRYCFGIIAVLVITSYFLLRLTYSCNACLGEIKIKRK